MINYENRDICKQCGGFCCKKCGCDYAVADFETLDINYLQKKLEEGNISIVSAQHFKRVNNKLINEPFLYLRARNIERPIVDLLSMKTTCSLLTDKGCIYSKENRPKGGLNLIPSENYPIGCNPAVNQLELLNEWNNYQKVLARLVKRLTGMSVDQKLKEDIYNLFLSVYYEQYEYVSEIEKIDIFALLPLLKEAYYEEYKKAEQKIGNPRVLIKK